MAEKPSKMKKEEISQRINELLQTKIDFTKLTNAELDQLTNALANVANVLQVAARAGRQRILSDSKGGLFGFGLLPGLLEEVEKRQQRQPRG